MSVVELVTFVIVDTPPTFEFEVLLYHLYCEIVPLPALAVTLRLFGAIFKHEASAKFDTSEVIVGETLTVVLIEAKEEELKLTELFVE